MSDAHQLKQDIWLKEIPPDATCDNLRDITTLVASKLKYSDDKLGEIHRKKVDEVFAHLISKCKEFESEAKTQESLLKSCRDTQKHNKAGWQECQQKLRQKREKTISEEPIIRTIPALPHEAISELAEGIGKAIKGIGKRVKRKK